MKKNKNKNRIIKEEKEGIEEKKLRTEVECYIEKFLEYLINQISYLDLTLKEENLWFGVADKLV